MKKVSGLTRGTASVRCRQLGRAPSRKAREGAHPSSFAECSEGDPCYISPLKCPTRPKATKLTETIMALRIFEAKSVHKNLLSYMRETRLVKVGSSRHNLAASPRRHHVLRGCVRGGGYSCRPCWPLHDPNPRRPPDQIDSGFRRRRVHRQHRQ